MIELKFYGLDSFSREVFVTKKGNYIVKIYTDFYTKVNNDPDGEPFFKVKPGSLKIVTEFSNNNNDESQCL